MPGRGAPRLKWCATYEEAEALLNAARDRLAAGAVVPPADALTLDAHGLDVLSRRAAAGGRDVKSERSRWRTHVERSPLATLHLQSVTKSDVRLWLDAMITKRASRGYKHGHKPRRKLSRLTIRNTLNLLRAVLQDATDRDLIPANPARDIRLPRGEGTTEEPWTYLTPDEQRALLTCPKLEPWKRRLIAFALGTGMRQGEVWNLQIRDVDLGKRQIVIRYGSEGGATKRGEVQRIPLFGIALTVTQEQIAALRGRPNPHGLLWPAEGSARKPKQRGARRGKGEPSWWTAALATAGIVAEHRHDQRHVKWHDLRHSCASSLIAGWWGRAWSLSEVQRLLRHRSQSTTERYAHLAPSVLDAAAMATTGLTNISPSPAP